MTGGGLSEARLARMHDVMAGYVERGEMPGLVTLICRRGELHVDEIGTTALGASDPMRRDTIFRIASLTKPVAAVAAMILVEECRLRLDDPVDTWLPELADRRVLRSIDGPLDDTVPANRPITLRDLLTFTLGFGLIMAPPGSYPIQEAINELELVGFGPPHPMAPYEPDEWLRRLGTLPLMHQPGEQWMYNTGSSVLGMLIARVSGQPLEAFLRERIFEPLGMRDTGFSVPTDKRDRLATAYQSNSETGQIEILDGVEDSRWASPPAFPDASGGLVSTIDDYLAFGRMMLDMGRYGNERILSRLSIEAMITDQLTPELRAASPSVPIFLGECGWGLGMAITTRRTGISAVPGRFGWDGGLGTSWASDPREDMLAILMTQLAWGSPGGLNAYHDFWTSAYQAIDD
jgi:CubicO group peptidase (beta-lactamase class C family)